MKICVNDEWRTVDAAFTLADLLAELGRNSKFCAVEKNRELVPRSEHANCRLHEGDQLEIVTLVGGG